MICFFKLIFCFFFILPLAVTGKRICRASTCGKNTFPVKFPFWLPDQQLPTNCGYPGFKLGCNNQGIVTLKLPQSEEFFVRSIDYVLQEIRLYDPSGCLANRLLKFNLSGSPFSASRYKTFSIFTCSSGFTSSYLLAVGCLSNLTSTVLAVPSSDVGSLYLSGCQELVDRLILVPRSPSRLIYELGDDIPLRWNVPSSPAAKGVRIFRNISLAILFCVLTVTLLKCLLKIGRMDPDPAGNTITTATATAAATTIAVTPPSVNINAGLDEATIQSYKKVVLGESCHLPGGHNGDDTCPICLSEYNVKETVKCIPECTHCFHADCIDEWLRLNGTCPVCRITPTPSPISDTRL